MVEEKRGKEIKGIKKEPVSIVVISLNEEKYIENLLRSIKEQRYPCEIIIVDGNSNDRTRNIAAKYTKNIIISKKRNISADRNIGGHKARSNIIVFMDADVVMPKNFLKENITEFKKRKLGIGTVALTPISSKKIDHLFFGIYNAFQWVMQFTPKPFAAGYCIIVKKEVFKRIGGYDPRVYYTDDCNFAIRARKYGFGILHGPNIHGSVRRLDKLGRLKFVFLVLKYTAHRILFGEYMVNNKKIKKEYRFGEF